MKEYTVKNIVDEWIPVKIDGKVFMQKHIDGNGINLFYHAKKNAINKWKIDPISEPFAFTGKLTQVN